jgi:hypothetical protein
VSNDPPVFPGRIDPGERFRDRRRRSRRRRRIRQLAIFVVLVGAAVALALNARFISGGGKPKAATPATTEAAQLPASASRLPDEIRGIHVTIGLASIPGKLDEYVTLADSGLNTVELDIKDEDGKVGFVSPAVPLAVDVGAQSSRYYNARKAVRKVHEAGMYLVGRLVVFQDSVLTSARPDLGVRTPDGGVWKTTAGAAWANPYDERVWKYNVDIAAAAAKAGFDEILFDYLRFPTDGATATARYTGQASEPRWQTVANFVQYATERLRPLGVRVSASLFGLAATRDLGIGQRPAVLAEDLDAIYPMVYPALYGSGEYDISDPAGSPGRTVSFSLLDYRRKLEGKRADLVPWLEDWSPPGRTYTIKDVRQQIEAARRARASGFILWNAGGVYTAKALSPR